ncbi:MAG: prepilin-type N-terminal cleavage/methylation domain-containing protein [Gammaproteobacteria bacterium]|nr:prepilin-type N-terminal cleavage/methylation domain-containing protein [Gammaproteobacteria bacterium]
MRRLSQSGFSLVELVVVVVLIGLLASGAGLLILQPIEAYEDQVRRQQLVDLGEMALRQIARDVRRALPNSIRVRTVGTGSAVEMVPVLDGARYRDEQQNGFAAGVADDVLDFLNPAGDAAFNLLGRLNNPLDSNSRLVVYNTAFATLYANAANNSNPGVITPAGTTLSLGATAYPNEDRITLSAAHQFSQQSPGQRVFLVDDPVSYVCNPASGEIVRHENYGFDQFQQANPGGSIAPVITRLSGCSMTYSAGSSQRGGILSIEITIDDSGESVNLLHQVHVVNVP